jgi:hypothetical protein
MESVTRVVLALTFALSATISASRVADRRGVVAPPRTPVLVELFTSEGCSSCPPADRLLTRLLADQPIDVAQVIALELHVDYWNHLGWKDPFSSAAFTKRQQDYSRIFGEDRVYTPQMVVDGAAELVGSDETLSAEAIRKAAGQPHLPLRVSAAFRADTVRLSVEAPAAPAGLEPTDIVVAVVEDGLTSAVRRGENQGRTLPHSAVVRRIEAIGALEKDPFVGEGQWRVTPAWQRPQLRIVAFLQGQKTRRIHGTAISAIN